MGDRPYLGLLRGLSDAGVEFAIAGGFAVVLHGVPRLTFDLDIVVSLEDENVRRLVAALETLGWKPRLPLPLRELEDADKRAHWVQERNLIAFTLLHPERAMEELDVLLVAPFPWPEIAASRVWRSIDGVSVPVIGKALLRRMKLATGREKDAVDAELLGEGDD